MSTDSRQTTYKRFFPTLLRRNLFAFRKKATSLWIISPADRFFPPDSWKLATALWRNATAKWKLATAKRKLHTANWRQPTAQRTDTSSKSTYGNHICICTFLFFLIEWSNAKELACRHFRVRNFQKCPTTQQKQNTS